MKLLKYCPTCGGDPARYTLRGEDKVGYCTDCEATGRGDAYWNGLQAWLETQPRDIQDADEGEVQIELYDAYMALISMGGKPCPECGGAGKFGREYGNRLCGKCDGSGVVGKHGKEIWRYTDADSGRALQSAAKELARGLPGNPPGRYYPSTVTGAPTSEYRLLQEGTKDMTPTQRLEWKRKAEAGLGEHFGVNTIIAKAIGDVEAARNELIKVLDYNHAPVTKAIYLLDNALAKLRGE